MRKFLGFYKSAHEAFYEGLVREVLNGNRDGKTLEEGEEFFAGLKVYRQSGLNKMAMWLFATNYRLFLWQHKTIGGVDELRLSDCESIEFGDITGIQIQIQKLFGILPVMPFEEVKVAGLVNHIVAHPELPGQECWYLSDQNSPFSSKRLQSFLADSLERSRQGMPDCQNTSSTTERLLGWTSMISLGLGLFVGGPAWMIASNLESQDMLRKELTNTPAFTGGTVTTSVPPPPTAWVERVAQQLSAMICTSTNGRFNVVTDACERGLEGELMSETDFIEMVRNGAISRVIITNRSNQTYLPFVQSNGRRGFVNSQADGKLLELLIKNWVYIDNK